MSQVRRGYLYGLSAYVLWGFVPLYFKLLRPSSPLEILAHRVVWSVVLVALTLAVARRWRLMRVLVRRPRALGGLAIAASVLAVNWFTYIYGVNTDRVVETSLGYFINPLVTVVLGVVVLRERLRPAQWTAVGIGAVAVAVLTTDYGHPPWIALTLALSFGMYGLVKKRLAVPAAEGLFVESGVLTIPALAYLGWLGLQGRDTAGISAGHTVLLMLTGAVTAVPLLLFAGAANRIPLSGLGILQYAAPVLQLGCGVLVFHEPMPPVRLAGFALVWLALIVFTIDGFRHVRRRSRVTPVLAAARTATA